MAQSAVVTQMQTAEARLLEIEDEIEDDEEEEEDEDSLDILDEDDEDEDDEDDIVDDFEFSNEDDEEEVAEEDFNWSELDMADKEKVQFMLKSLRNSGSLPSALDSITAIESEAKTLGKEIYAQNGAAIITVALARWGEKSDEFSQCALSSLVELTCHMENNVGPAIVGVGVIETALAAAKRHRRKEEMSTYMVGLLVNLALYEDVREEVARDSCIDFVMAAMRLYPEGEIVQQMGCEYFSQISKLPGTSEVLEIREYSHFWRRQLNSSEQATMKNTMNLQKKH